MIPPGGDAIRGGACLLRVDAREAFLMANLLLRAEGLRCSYGIQDVFSIDRLEIFDGDRIALVGPNGAGKTTLLRALSGCTDHVSGIIELRGTAHYQPQLEEGSGGAAPGQLRRWGVHDAQDSSSASGGEKARRKLAAAFSAKANLLLLDEPTANLDMEGVAWLEKELRRYRGAVLLVSHDRALMDNVCKAVFELENGALTAYPGSFSAYREQRAQQRDAAWKEYRAYREETARLQGAARDKAQAATALRKTPKRMGNSEARLHRRGAAYEVQEKMAKQAKALHSRLDHLEKVERPPIEADLSAAMQPGTPITSRTAAYVRGLTVAFGGREVLRGVDVTVETGKRTVIMGPNGAGKTTLVRSLLGEEGHLASGAKTAVLDQAHALLDENLDLLGNAMALSVQPEWAARSVLARLGLYTRDMRKPLSALSGGERAKTLLARMLVSDANFLVMDEPTNYLDLYAMDALEELLAGYEGTLLLVTHDRALCDAVADTLLWVEGGNVERFTGGYSAYRAAKDAPAAQEDRRRIASDVLRMRMAQLSLRIDHAPQEGKAALEAEYMELARQLRESQK